MLTFDWAADVEVEQLEEVVELADEWLSELLLILFLNLSNSEIFLSVMKVVINLCFSTAYSCTSKKFINVQTNNNLSSS